MVSKIAAATKDQHGKKNDRLLVKNVDASRLGARYDKTACFPMRNRSRNEG